MEKEIELLKDQMAKQKEVLEILVRRAAVGGITFEDSRTLRDFLDEKPSEFKGAVETESVNV